jgi:hypothetical protein
MKILVINLDRRPDRLQSISESLSSFGLSFTRIDAVDAADKSTRIDDRLCQRAIVACWMSHVRAFEEIAFGHDEFVLVLEDDAWLRPQFNWKSILHDLPPQMSANDLSYLQLGCISRQYKAGVVPDWLDARIQGLRSERVDLFLDGTKFPAIVGESRAGSHSYVISRQLASVVSDFNNPTWLGPDGFFDYLSQAQGVFQRWKLGRLATSMVEQVSRRPEIPQEAHLIDTDVLLD